MAETKEVYTLPLVKKIPYTLTKGKVITIGGVVNEDTDDGFYLGFSKEEDPSTERTFHYSARFTEDVVVRNSYSDESWGDEERSGSFPFEAGKPFEVKIVVLGGVYRVYVDNTYHIDFKHRLDKETANYLYIEGVVTIDRVHFGDVTYTVPHVSILPYTLAEGKGILVSGGVNESASGFRIGLSAGRDNSSETALDFNVIFSDKVVERNHHSKGWGSAEKHGDFPFEKNGVFEVKIVVLNHCYKVYVNNVHHSDFNHRLAKEIVRHLYVEGDVTIDEVAFREIDAKNVYEIPHTSSLPYTLAEGREITVGGVASDDASQFTFGFCEGPTFESLTTLEVCASFTESEVTRNHLSLGWGEEETSGGFPFKVGAAFEVRVVITSDAYQLYVDDAHHSDFQHKLDKESAHKFYIMGDVTLNRLSFLDTISNPTLPFTVPVLGGLSPGRTIVISGIPTGEDRFTVFFLSGISADHQDVAFCFDTRFKYRGHIKRVVRTHKGSGKWGSEETQISSFPFAANVPFKLAFTVHQDVYKVSVDDKHFLDFKHRSPSYQNVSYLNITGAVSITEVRV